MSRYDPDHKFRGYFSIGIENGKNPANIGLLWRTAHNFGAIEVFTIGTRYKYSKADTTCAYRHIPLRHYESVSHFLSCKPFNAKIVAIEQSVHAKKLGRHHHFPQAIYVLGAEDIGMSSELLRASDDIVEIPYGFKSLNVGVIGSIVMYDRLEKMNR